MAETRPSSAATDKEHAAARHAAESNPVPPGAACGARAAAVSPLQGPGPIYENGCSTCGTPLFKCELFHGERRFGLDTPPLGPDGKPLVRRVPASGLEHNAARVESIRGPAPRLMDVGRIGGAPTARTPPAPAGAASGGGRRAARRAGRIRAPPVPKVTAARETPATQVPPVQPGPRRAEAPDDGAGQQLVTPGPCLRQVAGLFHSGISGLTAAMISSRPRTPKATCSWRTGMWPSGGGCEPPTIATWPSWSLGGPTTRTRLRRALLRNPTCTTWTGVSSTLSTPRLHS